MAGCKVDLFKKMEEQAVSELHRIRWRNTSTSKPCQEGNDNAVFCVCRKGRTEKMYQCCLCKDLIHGMKFLIDAN